MSNTDWSNYAPDEFFTQCISEFLKRGFSLISAVAVSTDDNEYHVPTISDRARDTRMFFSHKTKALIVVVGYLEQHYVDAPADEVRAYWNIHINVKLNERLQYQWDDLAEEKEYGSHKPKFTLFNHAGWSSCDGEGQRAWNTENTDEPVLGIEQVATSLADGLLPLEPMLDELPFNRLQVTSWVPAYTFPGCYDLFWSRFDRRALKSFVTQPWGGTDPHKFSRNQGGLK